MNKNKKKDRILFGITAVLLPIAVLILLVIWTNQCKYADTGEGAFLLENEEVIPIQPNREISIFLPDSKASDPVLYRILFLTDFHVITYDGSESDEIIANAAPREAAFVDEDGNKSAELLKKWIGYANENEIDAVLFGGDIIDFPSSSNLSFLECLLAELKCPYLFTFGNHDWTYPWDYMTQNAVTTYKPMFSCIQGTSIESSTLDLGQVVCLSLDNSTGVYTQDYQKVSSVLEGSKPVIVLQHLPIATDALDAKAATVWKSPVTIGTGGIIPDGNSLCYFEAIRKENSAVCAVLSGHVHFDWEEQVPGGAWCYTEAAGYEGNAMLLKVHGPE